MESNQEIIARKIGRPPNSEQVEILPFESTLAYVFKASGGKPAAVNAARLLEESDKRFKVLTHAYDNLSINEQRQVRLEDLCAAAEIQPDEFLSKIIPPLWQRSQDISRVVAAIAQPKIVESAIEVATTGGTFGHQDRKMLLEATGFMPQKTGQTINIDASHKSVEVNGQKAIEDGPGLPSFAEDITAYSHVIRSGEQMPLISGTSIPLLPEATDRQSVNVPSTPLPPDDPLPVIDVLPE